MTQLETQPAAEAVDDIRAEALAEHARMMAQPLASRAPTPQEIGASMDSIWQQAQIVYDAGLGGQGATVSSVAAQIMGGYELGKGPIWAVRHLFLVHKRLGMSAEAMRGLFLERCRGGRLQIVESTADRCTIEAGRPGQQPTSETFELGEARKAGLLKGGGNWENWPKDMCCARATARLARRYWPDILGGVGYTPEELAENPDIAPPAPSPEADPDAPTAPTRGERQKPAPPQGLKERFEALCLSWKALADKWWPDEDAKAQGLRLRAWAASIVKTDEPLGKLESWTDARLAVCEHDLAEHGDPRPEDGREGPSDG